MTYLLALEQRLVLSRVLVTLDAKLGRFHLQRVAWQVGVLLVWLDEEERRVLSCGDSAMQNHYDGPYTILGEQGLRLTARLRYR